MGIGGWTHAADPTILGAGPATAITDEQTNQPLASLVIEDADGDDVTVLIEFPSAAGSFPTTPEFTRSGDVYTLNPLSPTNATTFLRALVFTPVLNRIPIGTNETITFTLTVTNDSVAVTNSDTTLVVTPVNNLPAIAGAGAVLNITDKQTALPFSAVAIADPDNLSTQRVTLTITLDNAAKGGFTNGVARGFALTAPNILVMTNTPAGVTAAMTNLVFKPVENRLPPGQRETNTFTLVVADTAAPPLAVTNAATKVAVLSTNDSPTISGAGATRNITDKETALPFSAVLIADPDMFGTQLVTLTVTVASGAKGNFTNGLALGFALAETNIFVMTNTPAAVTMALTNLVYQPVENRLPIGAKDTNTFTIAVADNATPPLAVTNTATAVVATSVNDNPELIRAPAAPLTVRTGYSVAPFAATVISDTDPNTDTNRAGQSQSLTVILTGANVSGQWIQQGFAGTTFTASNLTPGEATLALQNLVYEAQIAPLPAGVTNRLGATIVLSDGYVTLTNATTLIDVYSPYTPPGLAGTRSDQRVNDTDTIAPFAGAAIQSFNAGAFSVQVRLDDDAKGELINLAGFVKTGTPALYTFTGPSEQATLAIRQLLFRPVQNRLNGSVTETATFDITLIDGGTTNGPDSTTTVIVSPVNDRPILQGIPPSSASTTTRRRNPSKR